MKLTKYKFLFQGINKISNQIHNKKSQQKNSSIIEIQKSQLTYQFNQNIYKITLPYYQKLSQIFPNINLNEISQDFYQYKQLPSEILGKRTSKIIISNSQKYCIKVIQLEDLKKMEQIFKDLSDRFKNQTKDSSNANCLISIYSIFIIEYSLSGMKFCDGFILMPNIRGQFDHCINTFDIKGHLQSRFIDVQDFKDFKFGKDQNFVISNELQMIKNTLNQQKTKQFINIIEVNINFLASKNVIDYSLLISIENVQKNQQKENQNKQKVHYNKILLTDKILLKYAIIDYFQEYNQKKKMENKFKSLFKKSISSVDPQTYSHRLIKFLKEYLFINKK